MQRFCAILLFNILEIWQYWRTCCFGKGRGSTETPSKLFANHNALGQLTNHNTFCFSEGGPSSNPELIEPFVSGWGERYCNIVNYVKNNAIFEPPSMRACSSTPPKQNQDFVKEHNRTPLIIIVSDGKMKLCWAPRLSLNCIVKRFITRSFSRRCTLMTSCGQKVEKAAFASQTTHPFLDCFR